MSAENKHGRWIERGTPEYRAYLEEATGTKLADDDERISGNWRPLRPRRRPPALANRISEDGCRVTTFSAADARGPAALEDDAPAGSA